MRHLLANLNDISGALTRVSTHDELNGLFGNQLAKKNQEINKRISEQALDNKFVKDLALIFDTFYKDRLSLRALPFKGIGDFRLTGILRKEMLRETMDEIPHKYGSSPREDWWVFGQLAFIPVSESDNDEPEDLSHSNEMDQALDTVFESMREIEKQYQVSFPEIGITPIAIYRTP